MEIKDSSLRLLEQKCITLERTASSLVKTSRWAHSWVACRDKAQIWKRKVESRPLKESVNQILTNKIKVTQDSKPTSMQDPQEFLLSMARRKRKRREFKRNLLSNNSKRQNWVRCRTIQGTAKVKSSLMQLKEEFHRPIKTQEAWTIPKEWAKAEWNMVLVSITSRA